MTETWWHPETLARKRPFLDARRAAVKAVRAYFQAEGFIEVETPAIQRSPGIERHIRPFALSLREPLDDMGDETGQPRYLHTSPEFAMKKLLAGGLPKIMQLCRVWRDGERSPRHEPEFTMLEWYRARTDYGAMMTDCAALVRNVAKVAQRSLANDGLFRRGDQVCDPAREPRRLTVAEAFFEYAKIDLLAAADGTPMPDPEALRAAARGQGIHVSDTDTWEDIFFRVMLDRIEPRLGLGAPTILCEYPANLAALARKKPGDGRVAERFELYACGVELANAYSELTDPVEQRARFEADRALHAQLYGTAPPVDDELLKALGQLPPSSGCALGFDRLVMLATGADTITDVLWAPVT
ncbi:MAG: EF-P lysine aminoacylase GenX [Rhodospirillaceae bacterium]|nr:EF-P lysine aminoacylase GenX [Rhodospirillaceae bacterium]